MMRILVSITPYTRLLGHNMSVSGINVQILTALTYQSVTNPFMLLRSGSIPSTQGS